MTSGGLFSLYNCLSPQVKLLCLKNNGLTALCEFKIAG